MMASRKIPGKIIFSSVEECPQPVHATLTGILPSWLQGCLLRVGPAKFEWGDTKYKHWFDGEGLIHKFEITDDGRVIYSSQYVRSLSYLNSKEEGRISQQQFGTAVPPDPCKNIFSRFFTKFAAQKKYDNTNVNLVMVKERLLASTETSWLNRIDPKQLETVERVNLGTSLTGRRGWLAHPHITDDGTVYNLSSVWDKGVYEIIKVPPRQNELEDIFDGTKAVAKVSFHWKPSYYHSFAMTDHYFILFNVPFTISFSGLLMFMSVMDWAFKDMFSWDENGKTTIFVIDRDTGTTLWKFETEKMFIFHHVNAYEENGNVVIDVIGYKNASIVDAFYLHNLRDNTEEAFENPLLMPSLRRYEISLNSRANKKAGKVEGDSITMIPYRVIYEGIELPTINYKHFNCKKYQYAYGISPFFFKGGNSILKVNVQTGDVLTWAEENCYVSEPIFVAEPNAVEEDDGVILSAVINIETSCSFLLILDARTFQEMARASISMRIASSLHGIFLNDV